MASADGKSSRRWGFRILSLALLQVLSAAGEGAEETPDLEFLAYLGSWQGTDEEWLAVARLETEEQPGDEPPADARQEADDE
jgi:hypothetical protein